MHLCSYSSIKKKEMVGSTSVRSHVRKPVTLEDLVISLPCVILGQCLGPSPIFLSAFPDNLYSRSQPLPGTVLATVVAMEGESRVYRRQQFKIEYIKLVYVFDIYAFFTVYQNSLQDLVSICL